MLLSKLYSANNGMLRQKLGLMKALVSRFGPDRAKEIFRTPCPIVGASIGQHIRHAMDHIEKAVYATSNPDARRIHYDVRERGRPDETDMEEAEQRIVRVSQMLEEVTSNQSYVPVIDHRIEACFMLSGDDDKEFAMPSNAARELGFACHHAIHHMAMVRIIAVQTAKLPESDLPHSFGRAPSTLNFERLVDRAR